MNEGIRDSNLADELRIGNTITYFTVGVSMKPLLKERRTHVCIAPLDKAKRNDILFYVRGDGANVLHRCIKIDSTHYYMRGDNTYGIERIDKEQAIGRVTHIYRNGRIFNVSESCCYKLYVCFWKMTYPFRWFVHRAKSAVRKIIKNAIIR